MASDDKKARVELAEVSIQILETLEEKPEEDEERGFDLCLSGLLEVPVETLQRTEHDKNNKHSWIQRFWAKTQ